MRPFSKAMASKDQTLSKDRVRLPSIGIAETLGLFLGAIVPTLGKGVITRRQPMVRLVARLGLDSRAVARFQRLRERHGHGPVMLAIPIHPYAVLLEAEDVHRVLDGAPQPFAPASDEKWSSLAHFEADVSLVSRGEERGPRRQLNEAVLEMDCPVHTNAGYYQRVIAEEIGLLLESNPTVLAWPAFSEAWNRIVRRIVLGDTARDDRQVTAELGELREAANWAFLRRRHKSRIERLHRHLTDHLQKRERGSLAALANGLAATDETAPTHQIAHYLFAFDVAGIVAFRALALLAVHPEAERRARQERNQEQAGPTLPFLRASVLEAVRLWPTTPAILRQTTEETSWPGGVMPAGTGILIFAPFFHRDEQRLPFAHRFAPEIWLNGETERRDLALVPFSGGPAKCPGRNLVEMTCAMSLASLLADHEMTLEEPAALDPRRPMPGTLNHFALRFRVTPR